MSKARTAFVERIRAITAATDEPLLADRAPHDNDHNSRALAIRNGLAITLFASIEQFVRGRVAEVMTNLTRGGVSFANLPERLRDACTYGAIKALVFQAELRKRQKEDPTALIQHHAQRISTSSSPTFLASEFSLGWDKSNLSAADLKEILACFLIKDAWRHIGLIASRTGAPSLSLDQSFQQAAQRRHLAAHQADARTLLADIKSFLNDATGIALGFDALISRASRLIIEQNTGFLAGTYSLNHADIVLRFLSREPAGWREVPEGQTRAVRVSKDLLAARRHAEASASIAHEVLVLRQAGLPFDWTTTDAQ